MNCRTCGTQLPPGAANCPQYGAATPSYYSPTEAAPDDPYGGVLTSCRLQMSV